MSGGVLTLRELGADELGGIGTRTVLGSRESEMEEGDRLRTDSTEERRAGPERGREFGQ